MDVFKINDDDDDDDDGGGGDDDDPDRQVTSPKMLKKIYSIKQNLKRNGICSSNDKKFKTNESLDELDS